MVATAPAPKVTVRRNKSIPRYANPSTSQRLAEAVSFYDELHWGEPADKVTRKRIPKPPKTATKLGILRSVTYEASKGGELALWQHEFGEEGGECPDLVVDPKTRKLFIVGGTYDVQAAGIID